MDVTKWTGKARIDNLRMAGDRERMIYIYIYIYIYNYIYIYRER